MVFLRPTYLIDGDITDIDLAAFKQDGIKGIVLDLDSTLIAPRAGLLTEAAAKWLADACADFKIAVVSNNKRDEYIRKVANHLSIPVYGRAGKPGCNTLLTVLSKMGIKPKEAVLVGDRPLTDILGGQRAGMKTALVYPLKTMKEPALFTLVRQLERLIIRA
jgi:hypothetical protein